MAAPQELILREIASGDRVNSLSLGDSDNTPLKTFLRKRSKDFHRANIAKTYVLVPEADASRVWGYMTLICSEIKIGNSHRVDDCEAANVYNDFPAVKVARLAVDTQIQGRGYGEGLVQFAISVARQSVMPLVGCRFLITEAKPGAIGFYERMGFTLLDTKKNRKSPLPMLFLDLNKLAVDE